jgi:predicted nucleotidyltransferase
MKNSKVSELDMVSNLKVLKHELEKGLSEISEARLVYLFGSRARDDARMSSDYDFAVLTDRAADLEKVQATVAMLFSRTLDIERIDVVMLRNASIELAYAVIATGDVLYERDAAARVDYEAYVLGLYGDYLPVLKAQREDLLKGDPHEARVQGIERRLDELNERLARLEPFKKKKREEFDEDPCLRDIVERNLEVAVQCCIDIDHSMIALEKAQKPRDYYETFIRLGELGVLPMDFVREFALYGTS